MNLKQNFYNTSYIGYKDISELSEDSFVEITVNQFDLDNIDDNILGLIEGLDCNFSRVLPTGYVRVKDIPVLREYDESGGLFDIPEQSLRVIEPPEGGLFDGWRGELSDIKEEDLPGHYVRITYYKKAGFVNCKGVKSILYIPSRITEESIKDDFLVLSYEDGYSREDLQKLFKEWSDDVDYYFGLDILNIIDGVREYSPEADMYDLDVLEEKMRRIRESR